ncbi:hypothetical protein Q5P01_018656 [Channa striata]|uniref:C-type lectin domain-containing protein n=1 Tax=Channa striata TaxID=64152 RepID=A0AA88M4V2_CHASR|nr:hypothetical protein Q5P01_018656 [Channa striata]
MSDVVYSDVKFTTARGNDKEVTSPPEETTYSEIKTLQTAAEQPAASQQVESNKRSKVTSHRVSLPVLSVLLTAAVIGLCVVCFEYLQTKKTLQTLKDENETMTKNLQTMKDENETMNKTLQTLKDENEAIRKNLTDRLSEIKQCTRLQHMCPKPTEVRNNETCLKCEEGWEHHGPTCYYFSINKSTWNQSREECRGRGGDLVQIDSREEQTFLEKNVRNKMKESEDRFWIGLTDSVKEGRWLWVDGSELDKSLSFWSGKEPDDWKVQNPDGEDCVRMGLKERSGDLWSWFDKSCNMPHRRICEKAAQTPCHVCEELQTEGQRSHQREWPCWLSVVSWQLLPLLFTVSVSLRSFIHLHSLWKEAAKKNLCNDFYFFKDKNQSF